MFEDIYCSPEEFGVETIGQLDLTDESYMFDILLVQRSKFTGMFYINRDSGCSCPSPFEDYTTLDSLGKAFTAHEAVAKIRSECAGVDNWNDFIPDPSNLISAVMNA